MTVHVVIPARGGSKRVARKNIQDLGGRPLLAWTIAAAQGAGMSADLYVSTEDDEIAAVANRHGVRVIDRPVGLATDDATTEAVLIHALGIIEAPGDDYVMTLPPTSPLRSTLTIQRFVHAALLGSEDCLFSVHEHRGDFWREGAYVGGRHRHLDEDAGMWCRLFPDAPRTQAARTPLWEENGAVYLTKIGALRATGSILGRRARGVPIPVEESFDVNTEWDLEIVRAVVAARRGAGR